MSVNLDNATPNNEQGNDNQSYAQKWFEPIVILTVLLVVGVGVTAYIYWRQLKKMEETVALVGKQEGAMRGQLAEMQKQSGFMEQQLVVTETTAKAAGRALRVSERPYIEIIEVSVSLPFVADKPIVYFNKIENKGRTPAYDLQSRMWIDVNPSPLPENPTYRPVRTTSSRVTLGPGNVLDSLQTTNFALPQDAIDKINAGELFVYVYGIDEYWDAFDPPERHRVRFYSIYNPEERRFIAGSHHNDSD